MWRKISLRMRVMLIVTALTALTISGGLFSLWYSFQVYHLFESVVDENMAGLEAAYRLESALVMQKGYLTYFFQDSNTRWLSDLDRFDHEFRQWLGRAQAKFQTPEEKKVLEKITNDYQNLLQMRQLVIALYKEGKKQEGFTIHQEARSDFFQILDLTERLRRSHEDRIEGARLEFIQRYNVMRFLALTAMPAAVCLSFLLAFVLLRQVLGPIRRLVLAAQRTGIQINILDEVKTLSSEVHSLIEDVDQTKSELEASRVHLLQAAKMASVGKLAASVAHSIRNPLTSVKMRLFSLERSLDLSLEQRDDLSVISEEIQHIDNVLRNFLEYSRRPKLKVQRTSPSEVVDLALDLVKPRLDSSGIQVEVERNGRLPEIQLDPDQLKEALVNLLVNASEAVENQGRIVVREHLDVSPALGRTLVIAVSDNGPGVSDALRYQIFQPFFSTKDQGTGLGLSIALRIVEEHGGQIEITSSDKSGATFVIKLPLRED
ncbi:MAG: ATP-binding protein [Pseudomonadota bacterium]